jgi:hypothetical protein
MPRYLPCLSPSCWYRRRCLRKGLQVASLSVSAKTGRISRRPGTTDLQSAAQQFADGWSPPIAASPCAERPYG